MSTWMHSYINGNRANNELLLFKKDEKIYDNRNNEIINIPYYMTNYNVLNQNMNIIDNRNNQIGGNSDIIKFEINSIEEVE